FFSSRRRHTRSDRDWSSDVCSSDLYEVHHGVRIQDSAVIAAAMLSARYITDRRLPDKAIDLIDEAASRLRMEITSKPQPLDEIEIGRASCRERVENRAGRGVLQGKL